MKQKVMYEKLIKPALDRCLSFVGLAVCSPLYLAISIAVYLDDPGPVLFVQKRVGKNKGYFKLHKFRTMKISAPHDVPTHQLEESEQYITRAGRFLRRSSLDELPQLWDIFRGRMSIIGPRPALWNQKDLVYEREGYGANSVMPGLTGWAQVNGRDGIGIREKAKLDGDYVNALKKGGMRAFLFDARCFAGTVKNVLLRKGVIEGGTGRICKKQGPGNKRRSVLVVCQYYYPEPFRITDICEELVKRGFEVLVLTGEPNYPEGVRYSGYRHGQRTEEVIHGVRVHRCYTVPRKGGGIKRLLNYCSFAASATAYVNSGKCLAKDGNPFQAVFVNQLSPVMMAEAGIAYKKKYGVPMLLYCLDLWPESLVAGGVGRNSVVYWAFHKVSGRAYRSADRILVASRMFKKYLQGHFQIDTNCMEYLPQYAEGLFEAIPPKEEDGFTDVMFAGNIGKFQGLETVVKAAELMRGEDVRFHIVGGGTGLGRLQRAVRDKNLEGSVIFYGRRPLEEMPRIYAKADAMLVCLKADPVMSLTLPGKVQAYMACARPVIGAVDGEAAHVIREAKCGFCGPAGDAKALAENIRLLSKSDKKRMGANARTYYETKFKKGRVVDRMAWILENLPEPKADC